MISPILTYNSEVWGVYTKPDFKSRTTRKLKKIKKTWDIPSYCSH